MRPSPPTSRPRALFAELGDRHDEAGALGSLGSALQGARRFDEAITAHHGAAALFAELGDRHDEAVTLGNLGLGLGQARRFDEAITAHQQARALFAELGDRHREARGAAQPGHRPGGRMKSMWRVLTRKGRRSIANGR